MQTEQVVDTGVKHVDIMANDIANWENYIDSKISYLTLDCFDTIIWRKTATPVDIFYNLQSRPAFKKIGMNARLRAQAEQQARASKFIKTGNTEVSLRDVYLQSFPDLTEEDLIELEQQELQNDIATAYAFQPLIEVIKNAHKQGKKIIIISDTYYTKAQLQEMLQACLPAGVYAMIDKIYCSCENGCSKSMGLIKKVLKLNNLNPKYGLHIGDHVISDFQSSQKAGMNAVNLLHFKKNMNDLMRLQSVILGYLDQTVRHDRSLDLPLRGMLAGSNQDLNIAEKNLGYAVLGSIFYAFSAFIKHQITELKKTNQSVKIAFLMRDGYLPYLSLQAFDSSIETCCLRISRFASFAASFTSKESIDKYLREMAKSARYEDLCKQLLLPEALKNKIIKNTRAAAKPLQEFISQILQNDTVNIIIENAKLYRKRLFRHIKNTTQVTPGELLVFVDLGYSGTTQQNLQKIVKEELDVDIYGIYLLALAIPEWQKTRCGLIDPSNYDERIIHGLIAYIALFEQLSTKNEPSVVDYQEDGTPIHATTHMQDSQYQALDRVQSECLQFIHDANIYNQNHHVLLSLQNMRDIVLAAISRLIFLPTKQELDYLSDFKFDLNLGTSDVFDLYDSEKGMKSLIKRGLFFMERNLKTMRTNYPSELRYAGIELSMLLLGQHRYDFDLRQSDFSLRREQINIIAISLLNNKVNQTVLDAYPTYDGYYSVVIACGCNEYQLGIQLGLNYKWIQLESAELIDTKYLATSRESEFTQDVAHQLTAQALIDHGGGLFECTESSAMLIYVPELNGKSSTNQSFRLVFRPIIKQAP